MTYLPSANAWYTWADEEQTLPWTSGTIGMSGLTTIERPPYNTAEGVGHTLGQYWAMDGPISGCYSDVEAGWTVDPVQFALASNPAAPHLFVFNWDCGLPGCYNGCGTAQPGYPRGQWVAASSSVYAGMELACCHQPMQFDVYRYHNNWWVAYGGTWVGYFPQAAYPSYFNWGLTTLRSGGEVSSRGSSGSCHDMGDGLTADNPGAAYWSNLFRITGSGDDPMGASTWMSVAPHSYEPPANYLYNGGSTTGFRYGGPGYC